MPRKKSESLELSKRELAVAELIAQDLKPSEIAKKLKISVKTVSTYRARLLEKLKKQGVKGDVGIALHIMKMKEKPPEPPKQEKKDENQTADDVVPADATTGVRTPDST